MALGTKKPNSDINVTPLIDVVLVLLIIFMVLTPLAEKQKYTRVPEYQPDAQPVPPDSVPPDQTVLTVLANGTVVLNKQPMTIDEAMARIGPAYDGRPSKPLFFNAEDKVHYHLAMKVLDAAHGVGVNTIGLMTDPPIVQTETPAETPAEGAPAEGAPAPK
jgi:biopolymer transport protein ExbD